MTDSINLAEAFQQELEASRAATSSPSPDTPSSFAMQRFTLFTVPGLIIYLQGAKAVDYSAGPELAVQTAFELATTRRLGPGRGPAFTPEHLLILDEIETNKTLLYRDKAWHSDILTKLIEAGVNVYPKKAASRAELTLTLNSYFYALAEFLQTEGLLAQEEMEDARAVTAAASTYIKQTTSAALKPLTAADLEDPSVFADL